jgi:hypothetical protein
MDEELIEVITDPNLKTWLDVQKRWAIDLVDPGEPHRVFAGKVLDERISFEHGHVIVPIPDFWISQRTKSFIELAQSQQCRRFYAAGFDFKDDLYLSTPVESDAVGAIYHELLGYGIMVPKNLEFCILHTPFDYWIISGKRVWVEALLGEDLDSGIRTFEKAVEEGIVWEPGPKFCHQIVSRCQKHNNIILKSLTSSTPTSA